MNKSSQSRTKDARVVTIPGVSVAMAGDPENTPEGLLVLAVGAGPTANAERRRSTQPYRPG